MSASLKLGTGGKWGVKAGSLLAYSDTDGKNKPLPFDFTRASSATVVDENGLVNYAEIIGSELVTNGTFATSDLSDFSTTYATHAIVSEELKTTLNTANGYGFSTVSFTAVVGRSYRIQVDAQQGTADTTQIKQQAGITLTSSSATTGSWSFDGVGVATATTCVVRLQAWGANADYSIFDNVSVKEVTRDNLPRIDYTGGAGPHLLLEPQRINLIITSATGNYGNSPGSEILAIAPDGENTAIRPVPDNPSDRYQETIPAGTYSSGDEVTYSWYRKRFSTPAIGSYVGDLQVGSLINCTQVGVTTEIASSINGYDRFSATLSITDGALQSYLRFYFGNVIGTGNSSVAYWGHQLEVGSYATSYIPTSGTTVTRIAETCSQTGISNSINSTEGVLFVEMAALSNDLTYRILSLSDGTDNERIYIQYTDTTNQVSVVVKVGGSTQANIQHTLTDETVFSKMAFKWKANDFAFWIDGVEVGADTSGSVPSGLNRLALDRQLNTNTFYGKVKQLQVYKTALTDAELTALTTL